MSISASVGILVPYLWVLQWKSGPLDRQDGTWLPKPRIWWPMRGDGVPGCRETHPLLRSGA